MFGKSRSDVCDLLGFAPFMADRIAPGAFRCSCYSCGLHTIPTLALGVVEGSVCGLQQGGDVSSCVVTAVDSRDAHRDRRRRNCNVRLRFGRPRPDAFCEREGGSCGRMRRDDRDLVAPSACP